MQKTTGMQKLPKLNFTKKWTNVSPSPNDTQQNAPGTQSAR